MMNTILSRENVPSEKKHFEVGFEVMIGQSRDEIGFGKEQPVEGQQEDLPKVQHMRLA